jgi:basic membrane protein A and related proteins
MLEPLAENRSRRGRLLRRNRSIWSALLFALMILAAACGGEKAADTGGGTDTGGEQDAASDIRVGLALDVGGLGDKSFNDAANRGLQQAIEDGLVSEENTDLIETNQTGSNRDANVVNLADSGYDLILGIGFSFSPGIDEIAGDYPDQYFGVIDGFAAEADNVANLTFKEHEGSFLVGAAAAMKSETGTIGFLGGQEGTGLIEKFEAGYVAGAQAINPDIEVLVEYIGDSVEAFVDVTKGEALSANMFDDGADVIYHAAGQSGLGLFKAAVEADRLAIGVDSDQSLTASPEEQELILTSMLKRVDTAVYNAIQQVVDGEWQSGNQIYGLAEEGVDYAINEFNDNDELLSAEIQAQLDEFKQQIIDGEITVPEQP